MDNPFYWDKLVVSAIGDKDFNPTLSWVFKFDSVQNRVVGDVRAYIDDLRSVGWSLEHGCRLARSIVSKLQFLGIQDAPKKRRIDGGPRASTMYSATMTEVSIAVTPQKWEKGRNHIL